MGNFAKIGNHWNYITVYKQKIGGVWTTITESDFRTICENNRLDFGGVVANEHTLSIVSLPSVTGETYSFVALLDDKTNITTACTWSLVSGGMYAVLSGTGTIAILSLANNSNVTVRAEYDNVFAERTITVTYEQGVTADTETEVVTDESGNTTTTTTTTIDNGDGSSQVETTTVITDESGNTIGSQESTTNNNADGSYDSTSTTYDGNGDPTETTNASGDTDGNVSTQGIAYENGEPVVTGYTVDTSGNPDGEKNYSGTGVNTEYYAFDMTHGFVLHMHFTINFNQQPPGQNENHHNILTMKRASPSPWYGFQIRQSSTNKYVQLGTQFSTGSNTNTTINPKWITTNVLGEYDLTITYTPSASTNAFVCYNNLTSTNVYSSNNKFPDIDDLKYLKVTIGYAMDPNGDPYRYSSINVLDFSITRM